MASSTPSVDELVAVLRHSSLPTVIVEGKSDMVVYRRFEQFLGSGQANFLPCGGRSTVLQMYDRRVEFANIRTCFIADRDMWLFVGVPAKYEEVIVTSGYSLENDVYRDGDVERLLNADEKVNHEVLIRDLCRWFAFQIEEFVAGRDFMSDPHLNHLIPLPGFTCSASVLIECGFKEPSVPRFEEVHDNYKRVLRGKVLYEVIVRFSHAPHRTPRYSYDVLWEISVAYGIEGPLTTRLLRAVSECLKIPLPPRQLPLRAIEKSENAI